MIYILAYQKKFENAQIWMILKIPLKSWKTTKNNSKFSFRKFSKEKNICHAAHQISRALTNTSMTVPCMVTLTIDHCTTIYPVTYSFWWPESLKIRKKNCLRGMVCPWYSRNNMGMVITLRPLSSYYLSPLMEEYICDVTKSCDTRINVCCTSIVFFLHSINQIVAIPVSQRIMIKGIIMITTFMVLHRIVRTSSTKSG